MNDRLAVGKINAQVFLSPHPVPALDPLPALLSLINGAKTTLTFAEYSFTSKPIADALLAAHGRGVHIIGIADASEAQGAGSQIAVLQTAGIDIKLWGSTWRLGHDKVWIVDSATRHAAVSLGSYNATVQAETENLEIMLIATGLQVSKILAPAIEQQIITARG